VVIRPTPYYSISRRKGNAVEIAGKGRGKVWLEIDKLRLEKREAGYIATISRCINRVQPNNQQGDQDDREAATEPPEEE